MEYELIREIFNNCSGNQMRDVFVEEITTDNPRAWLEAFLGDKQAQIDEFKQEDGTYIFNVEIAGLRQRFSFTPE